MLVLLLGHVLIDERQGLCFCSIGMLPEERPVTARAPHVRVRVPLIISF